MRSASCKITKFAVILRGLINEYSVTEYRTVRLPSWGVEAGEPDGPSRNDPRVCGDLDERPFYVFYFLFLLFDFAPC